MSQVELQGKVIKYPSKVATCTNGKCLIATRDVPAKTKIQKFEGPIVTWDQVPTSEICHALLIHDQHWLIPTTNARYINHSCDPNCIINDDLFVVTIRSVQAGNEFSFSYNLVTKGATDPGPWDPRWTFKCDCGAVNCQGLIDRYVYL
jgi:hypothetical protein